MRTPTFFSIFFIATYITSSAQFISIDKNADNYFGIFGETIGSGLGQATYNVNIGRDFVEATRNSLTSIPPVLKFNPNNGAPVEMGGEVNRVATSNADLLPYAYGNTNGSSFFVGTNNYTAVDNPSGGYTEITFNDTSVDFNELSIIATPKRIAGPQSLPDGLGTQIQIIQVPDGLTSNSHKFRVEVYDKDGNPASRYFSFIV